MIKVLKRIPLLLVLILALFMSQSPPLTVEAAVTNYCYLSYDKKYISDDKKVHVIAGSNTDGACHITNQHMASPGSGEYKVNGILKSQFRFAFDAKAMANIGSIVITNSTPKKDPLRDRYTSEAYVVTLNQDVRVVWYWDADSGRKSILTMYPIKNYGSEGPNPIPSKIEPVDELQLESEEF